MKERFWDRRAQNRTLPTCSTCRTPATVKPLRRQGGRWQCGTCLDLTPSLEVGTLEVER